MDYQQIICKDTGKSLKADLIYKIRNDENCIENIVSICKNCPYSDSNNSKCQNCHGTIVQKSTRQLNLQTGRMKMDTVNYKNTFLKVGEEYMQMMDADEFLDNMDIVANLNSSNWNHGQRICDHLRGYDSPKTYKTDCANCKLRCHKNGELTTCEKAKEFVEKQGINLATCSEQQIKTIALPQEYICKEQVQTCYFI